MIKVSVIVPVYNSEKYLERCLESLVNQTLKEIEIICIDDGSTDNSLQILNNYAEKYTNIIVLTQQHKKQGAARNLGMLQSTGEYIGFADSDDWVDLEYFEKLHTTAKKYDADISLATNIRIGNGKTKKRLNITDEIVYQSQEEKYNVCRHWKNECPTNKLYKRRLLQENSVHWPEEIWCEDKLFTTQAIYYANKIVTVPNINYYYYRNPKSTVNNKDRMHRQNLKTETNTARHTVIKFFREKQLYFMNKKYWFVKSDFKFMGITFIRIKESVCSKSISLFGVFPILEFVNEV